MGQLRQGSSMCLTSWTFTWAWRLLSCTTPRMTSYAPCHVSIARIISTPNLLLDIYNALEDRCSNLVLLFLILNQSLIKNSHVFFQGHGSDLLSSDPTILQHLLPNRRGHVHLPSEPFHPSSTSTSYYVCDGLCSHYNHHARKHSLLDNIFIKCHAFPCKTLFTSCISYLFYSHNCTVGWWALIFYQVSKL